MIAACSDCKLQLIKGGTATAAAQKGQRKPSPSACHSEVKWICKGRSTIETGRQFLPSIGGEEWEVLIA